MASGGFGNDRIMSDNTAIVCERSLGVLNAMAGGSGEGDGRGAANLWQHSQAYRQAVCTGSASQAEGRHQFNSCKSHIVRAQCADNVTIHCAGASQTCMIVCVCPVNE